MALNPNTMEWECDACGTTLPAECYRGLFDVLKTVHDGKKMFLLRMIEKRRLR